MLLRVTMHFSNQEAHMSAEMVRKLTQEVSSKSNVYLFEAEIYRSKQPEDRKIEPGFYEKWVQSQHQGVHHEIKLLRSPAYGRTHPDIEMHVHKNPHTGEFFVCYTGQIDTPGDATGFFKLWCAGMVYTIERNEDFGPVWQKHGAGFLEFLEKKCEISLRT